MVRKFTKTVKTHMSSTVMLLRILQKSAFHIARSCKYLEARIMAPKTILFQLVGQMSISA